MGEDVCLQQQDQEAQNQDGHVVSIKDFVFFDTFLHMQYLFLLHSTSLLSV